jgi:hypothetical protein
MLKRLLLAVLLFPFVVPIHAEVNFPRIGGAAVHQCVKVVDGVDVAVGRASTLEKNAIADCLNAAGRDIDGRYEVVVSYRIGISISSDARAQLFPFIPDVGEPDPGEPGAPPAGWAAVQIDGSVHTLVSSVLSYTDPIFTVGANGGEIYSTDDSFAAYYYTVPTTGDFTLTAEIVTASQEVAASKGGLMLRESLNSGSAHSILAVFAHNGTLVDSRVTTDGSTTSPYADGVDVILPECFRIEVDRDIPSVKYFSKADATDCSTGTYTELYQEFPAWAGTAQNIYALLATTPTDSNDIGKNATTTFDQVVVSTASVTHTPGDVGFNPTAYQISEESTPVTLTVSRTGDGSGACSLDYVVNDGSALAGTDYTDTSGTLSWTDSEIGDKTFNVTIIDRNGTAQGNKQFTAVLTKDTCASDNLNDATATVTILDQDAAAASFSAMSPTDTILPDIACHGCAQWKAYMAAATTFEYRQVTNRNPSGAGSFSAAVTAACTADITYVVPIISGKAVHAGNTSTAVDCDGLIVDMTRAPSPGFHIEDMNFVPRDSQYQLWLHYSCWNDSSVNQGVGHCLTVTDNTSGEVNQYIIILNAGTLFTYDGGLQMFRRTEDSSIIQAMSAWPIQAAGGVQQILQLGPNTDDLRRVTYARSVGAHFNARCPMFASVTGTLSNNICYNGGNSWTLLKVQVPNIDQNVVSNLYVYGPDSSGSVRPIRYGPLAGDITEDFDVFTSGNRAKGFDDSTQAGMILDNSAGQANAAGAVLTGAIATGYVSTAIGAGDQGERDFAALVCANSGPRPNDRLPIYQQVCDEIDNLYAGSGSTGTRVDTVAEHNIGYPSVANNAACDPFVADSCGTGVPALPAVEDAADADTYINKLATAMWGGHCARSAVSATGC